MERMGLSKFTLDYDGSTSKLEELRAANCVVEREVELTPDPLHFRVSSAGERGLQEEPSTTESCVTVPLQSPVRTRRR